MTPLFLLIVLLQLFQFLPGASVLAEPLPLLVLGTPVSNARPISTSSAVVGTSAFDTALHDHIAVTTTSSIHFPSKPATMEGDGDGSIFPLDASETKPNTNIDTQDGSHVNIVVILAICAAVLLTALFGVGLALIRMRRGKRPGHSYKHHTGDANESGLPSMPSVPSDRAGERNEHRPAIAAHETTHEEPPPPYLPSPPETAHERHHSILPNFLGPGREPLYEIELNSPSFMVTSISSFTPLEEQMRANSLGGQSDWTDCSVTEPTSARTASFTSQDPMPANSFVTAKRLSLIHHVNMSQGYVGNQVRRLNSTSSKLSLTPIQPTPYLQPEVLSPKETTKTFQFRGGFYTQVN